MFCRSKTPTAELYASTSQEKERLPNRPKTPLVDTRNMRSKTPTALTAGSSGAPSGFSRNDASRASLGGHNGGGSGAPPGGAQYDQVWSLTQLYSVEFSQSMIDVKKCVFN